MTRSITIFKENLVKHLALNCGVNVDRMPWDVMKTEYLSKALLLDPGIFGMYSDSSMIE